MAFVIGSWRAGRAPWNDAAPIRNEIFVLDRLRQHAASLAMAQQITPNPVRVLSLRARLDDNAAVLLAAYRASAAELEQNRDVLPAAEWLLDNYHLVEAQIQEIRSDLPPGYYRQLPKLAAGPFAGYPRVFGLAWAFVAHTDSNFDPDTLVHFITAYQAVQPLSIGELWAIAISLRVVLVENLRRLTGQISDNLQARADAEAFIADLRKTGVVGARHSGDRAPLATRFAAELAKLLRDQDPMTTPALPWLEQMLIDQGTTVDTVVRQSQQEQGESNVSVRNVITSMRLISDIDWGDLVESVSLVDAALGADTGFAAMDFRSRNSYRDAVERLARGSGIAELAVAEQAVSAASAAGSGPAADPGYYLVGNGRADFEARIDYRPPPGHRMARGVRAMGLAGYVAAVVLATMALLVLALWLVRASWSVPLLLFAIGAILAFSDAATALVNRAIAAVVKPVMLPALEFADGVPSEFRTMVVVPAMLVSDIELADLIERLEVHHLNGVSGDLSFALLLDGVDAKAESLPDDARLLDLADAAIAALNARYPPGPAGPRFWLFYRRRLFNPSQGFMMGWERKRGKLHEFNRLLRGARDTSFVGRDGGSVAAPSGVRFVITLDSDTLMPRDTAARLVGKLAHPLNRPVFDPVRQRVVSGHGILQPRVTPSLNVAGEGSIYRAISSGPGGIDPYAGAVSDVYQDLFGQGSFTGKGIYDVDAFEASLAGRVGENELLSHDLFEGIFARAGLVTDIEVIEDFPSRYDVAARRQHRWTRGDWQLLPWAMGPLQSMRGLPLLGRLKMLDNLRRSLVAPGTLLALFAACLMPPTPALAAVLSVVAAILLPAVLPPLAALWSDNHRASLARHLSMLREDAAGALLQTGFTIVTIADRAWRNADAIVRTLWRLSRRTNMLEWTTAAQAARRPALDLPGSYLEMSGGVGLGVVAMGLAIALAPADAPLAVLLGLVFIAAPAVAWMASQPPTQRQQGALPDDDAADLRRIARRTWRFFETFVTLQDNYLPPDNFQETPKPLVANRTSPTNMGLYLLSTIAARDFGWIGVLDSIERLEVTLDVMDRLQRHRGHFYNWYDTRDLRVLDPAYVSSVDSGNLAGHLIAIANACEEASADCSAEGAYTGIGDALALAATAAQSLPTPQRTLAAGLAELAALIDVRAAFKTIEDRARAALATLPAGSGPDTLEPVVDLHFWLSAIARAAAGHQRDADAAADPDNRLQSRQRALAERTRAMALAMDFGFLLDPERKLLSIGFSPAENRLDSNCYDLLASEARLASLFAIAKGDLATSHWFHLGRTATPIGSGSALISWSGSMFEYLMPSLVMRAPEGSLLEQTNRLIVTRQRQYAGTLGVPWGISESGYNARDLELTYQYSNFGVPGLGLKRGLSENLVIAPYATGLAAMVDADAACRNYAHLATLGALGRFGYFEAVDFTRSRLPAGQAHVVVRNVMAHHQGMTIVGIANALHDGRMRDRFHREPMVQACALLLQERVPRNVAVANPRAEEVGRAATEAVSRPPASRRLSPAAGGPPVTHLLSNGMYDIMLTATGGGYSRWNDIAITRWRGDPTRDDWGSFIVLHDVDAGARWSATAKPIASLPDEDSVFFAEDHASFVRRHGPLTTTTEIVVSGDGAGEVRRVTIANNGRRARRIELTSYAELVLTSSAADSAHPAFAKMFVETEFDAEHGALIATRRPRGPDEPPVWAAHMVVVEGDAGPFSHESDRSRFIGRGRDVETAAGFAGTSPLSNSVGTVLDPIFALRQQVRIAPGKTARLAFWTLVAASRAELIASIEQHGDRNAFDRSQTLAWTQAQVQLRYLGIGSNEAVDFQRLAAPLLYPDARMRPAPATIERGAGLQSALWPMSISGDYPIVLLHVDEMDHLPQVRQLLRAQEFWRLKGLAVDVVIINEHASSYLQDLQSGIEAAIRRSTALPGRSDNGARGSVHLLRADLMTLEARALLLSVARVALSARRGPLIDQLAPLLAAEAAAGTRANPTPPPTPRPALALPALPALEFFNGLGGFAENGREYVTILEGGATTPAPWVNVIANPRFGMQVSAEGSGYCWSENSKENQLTPWSNDPVRDPVGETILVRDMQSGALFGPTALPVRDMGRYVARHGFGYSRFEHAVDGIEMALLQFVPLADPVRISRLRLTNTSGRRRQLSVTSYAEWVLGATRASTAPHIITRVDERTGALLAQNPWNMAFPGRVAFADLGGRQTSCTGDRTEFIGIDGSLRAPAGLVRGMALSNRTGAGLDPCAALQAVIDLEPGQSINITALLGQAETAAEAEALVEHWRAADIDAALAVVTDHWATVLGTVQVSTPDRAMDIMLNGWLLYQTLACRIWARAGFYQASGAFGFRDQLQDGMAICLAQPAETRAHLLRAAARQFPEGDVQHWWLPHSGQGVRTRISDDRVWLAYAVATYVASTGDAAVLGETIPFLDGPLLPAHEADTFFQPMIADESASLFEHCGRGLDLALKNTGAHGLPLMGSGDWNDGMNRVGGAGRGESVWLGWLLVRTIALFAPHADARAPDRAKRWRTHAARVAKAIETHAWDGEWYRRATFDDGTWLGTHSADECRIDSIAQSWAVLSGKADPVRARQAMAVFESRLVRRDPGLALLFTPPFDKGDHDPGYIKGYPPGLRENGGQYSHAAMWAIHAHAQLGDGDKAVDLFSLLNPINHASTAADAAQYRVEPYVLAADIYSVAPNAGRGGWTWYTGAAGWMYRAGIEAILGLRRAGDVMRVEPVLPAAWPGYSATIAIGGARSSISVTRSATAGIRLDGVEVAAALIPIDGIAHRLEVSIG
jgi:cyclic beta-1,2-glucan synthetase